MSTDFDTVLGHVNRCRKQFRLKRCREIAVNYYFLVRGWKPCLLFDFCAISPSSLLQLSVEILGGEDVGVLQLNQDDLVVYRRPVLCHHLHQLLHSVNSCPTDILSRDIHLTSGNHAAETVNNDISSGTSVALSGCTLALPDNAVTSGANVLTSGNSLPPLVIDVTFGSGENTCSAVCISCNSDSPVAACLSSLSKLWRQLETPTCALHVVQLEPEINLATVFGLLLGFPVVYWFNTGKEGNCLSFQDLYVFSVRFAGAVPISFSVPASVQPPPACHPTCTASRQNTAHDPDWLGQISELPARLARYWLRGIWPGCDWGTVERVSGEQLEFTCTIQNLPHVTL